jgi:hypothetical protein
LLLAAVAALAAMLLAAPAQARSSTDGETAKAERQSLASPVVKRPVAFAISRSLRELAGAPPRGARWFGPGTSKRSIYLQSRMAYASDDVRGGAPDLVAQRTFGAGTIPAPLVSFEGIPQESGSFRPVPPDTVGEIGPNHYVQMVNVRYAVYDRTGRPLVAPVSLGALFGPLGSQCGISGVGDPIVLYDQLADRWVLTQFGFLFNQTTGLPVGPYYECIAISKTPDPTGEYYLYAFKWSDTKLNDYPKLGVWPDAYYVAANQFVFNDDGSGSYQGAGVAAYDREAMLRGDPNAAAVTFDLASVDPNLGSLLPSDLDGRRLPPAGAPNTFIEVDFPEFGFPTDQLTIFQFHVDWEDPTQSRVTGPTALATAAFDPLLCNFNACVPQKGTFAKLDPLSDRLMQRLAYRNFGDHESLVLTHAVDAGGDHAGMRWYEIRSPRSPVIYQQGTYAPDDDHRWMGSIAMDGNGNIGLGYSVSGTNLFPSIRYTGRLASDPLGELPLGEGSLVEGTGSQTTPFARWGDYSALTVDPNDDCTFWFTTEYYTQTSEVDWHTRIGAFMVDPECDATAPTARAKAAKATRGKDHRLAYTTSDNKGETAETITVLRPNGKKLKTYTAALGPAGAGSLSIKAPGQAGAYRWCVIAEDAKGNESAESCAKLTVR